MSCWNIVSRVSLNQFFGCLGVFFLSMSFLLLPYLSLLQSVCGVWVPLGPGLLRQIPDKGSWLGPAGWISAARSSPASPSHGPPPLHKALEGGALVASQAPLCFRATIAALGFWNDWHSDFSSQHLVRSQVFFHLCFYFCF